MKRLIMTLCFIAAAVALTAQQWNIAIEHNEINACLTDGCCTTNNETVFVGYWDSEAYNYLFYSSNFLTSCILNVPDNHDILIISRGQGNCPSVLRFDHDFNLLTHHVIHEQKLDQLGHEAISDYWIDNDNLLVVAEVTDPDIHNKEFIVFGRTSINSGYIYEDTWINKTDTLNYNIENHSMCAVNDTTIYLISRARIGSWLGPVAMEIYLVTKDLEILGSRYFYDETWYWPKTAIATKDDGIVAISYSPKERTYIKKLLREDFNPIPCSISEVPIERLKATAFPNPTQGELCIDISRVSLNEKDVRIKIFNNEGKICLDRIIKGQGNLLTIDVSGLSNGVYSFQIVKENKTIITNRFIKE